MVSIVWRPSGPALRAARHVGGACGLGPRVGGGGRSGLELGTPKAKVGVPEGPKSLEHAVTLRTLFPGRRPKPEGDSAPPRSK